MRNSRRRSRFRFLLAGLLVLLLLAGGFAMMRRWEVNHSQVTDSQEETDYLRVRYDGKWYRENPALETCLLMGVDHFDEQESSAQQSDFLLLLIVDREKKTCIPLQLNRDIMTQMPVLDVFGEAYDTKVQQLALSYSYGSNGQERCRNTVKTVSDLLYGIPVDHYISVTMDAVSALNDLVGGVTVHVKDDFSRADPSIEQGKDVTLNGEQALHFVRARMDMAEPTNLARMERQRVYMQALRDKIGECMASDEEFALKALDAIGEYMITDCSANKLSELMNGYTAYDVSEIETVQGEATEGERFMEFYPDEAALQEQAIRLFFVADSVQ